MAVTCACGGLFGKVPRLRKDTRVVSTCLPAARPVKLFPRRGRLGGGRSSRTLAIPSRRKWGQSQCPSAPLGVQSGCRHATWVFPKVPARSGPLGQWLALKHCCGDAWVPKRCLARQAAVSRVAPSLPSTSPRPFRCSASSASRCQPCVLHCNESVPKSWRPFSAPCDGCSGLCSASTRQRASFSSSGAPRKCGPPKPGVGFLPVLRKRREAGGSLGI